jgi:asparagine synthase (glutamine-hydrolysing)
MLSGGLDSSSIVGIASRILAEDGDSRLSTFSAIFPSLADIDRRIDERPFIKAVLDTVGNLEPHYVHADRLSPLAFYDRFIWHTDEAVPAPNLYMDWAIFSAAQEQGTRVLLGGLDGDTTVSYGYDLLAELARTGRWMALIREATAFRARYYATTPLRKIIRHYALRPLVPQPIVDIWRTVRRRPQRVSVVDMPINPEFAQRIGLVKRARVLQDHPSGLTHTARKMHWMSLSSGLLLYALELLDKVAAACSLEARYPFFDRRLIEFCIGLPCTQKLHQGWTRAIHRSAVAGILPEEVRCRIRKGNLSANFKLRLLEDERDTLERIILKEMNTLENYIDTSALHTKYFRYASQPMEQEQDALAIFFAVTLAIWLNGSGFCA